MKRFLLTSLISLSVCSSVLASEVVENMKKGKNLEAVALVINNYNQFIKEWETTSLAHAPNAKEVKTAKVGDTVHLIALMRNCTTDEKNYCNVSFKVNMLKDNNIIIDSKPITKSFAYLNKNVFQLSPIVLMNNFEENEVGNYRYEVIITDQNSRDKIELKTYLKVSKK